MKKLILTVLAIVAMAGATVNADTLLYEDFNSYSGTGGSAQIDTGLECAYGGGVGGWDVFGTNTMHAVDLANLVGESNPSNWAIMIHSGTAAHHVNLITRGGLNANTSGESYEVNFDYGTGAWAGGQETGAADGLLVEVLRTDNTVLASGIFMPGVWGAGNYNLDAGLQGTLTYVGDGTGNVRLQISPSNPHNNHWSGTIDNIEILGPPAPPPPFTGFTENFNGYWGTQNAAQAVTGLNVAHSGGVDGWGRSGGGTMHAVDLGSSNWAIMLWADNVITRYGLNANDLGENYALTFDYGTAAYGGSAPTAAGDGVVVEILRADNTVLASGTFMPGAWGAGNYNLDGGHQGSLVYAGDGSGVVSIRIGPSSSGRFAGEIDNVALDFTEVIAVTLAAPTPITWSGMSTALVADVATDPNGQLNYTWYAEPDGSGDPNLTVTITPDAGDNSAATIEVINDAPTGEVVNITVTVVVEEGTAIEGTSTPVTIDVYDTACLAAREGLGLSSTTDLVVNCKTDLADFAEIATAWLENYAPDAPQPRP